MAKKTMSYWRLYEVARAFVTIQVDVELAFAIP